MIRPVIPRQFESEQFVVLSVGDEYLEVQKPSSVDTIQIPRAAVLKYQPVGEGAPPWMTLDGRLQLKTRSRSLVFLPEQPADKYGCSKESWNLGRDHRGAWEGLEAGWVPEQELGRCLSQGWSIFYGEDGYYLRIPDRPSDSILICK